MTPFWKEERQGYNIYQDKRNIDFLPWTPLYPYNISAFEDWKCEVEENCKCKFVKRRDKKDQKKEILVDYYQCNRSGQFKTRRTGKRRRRARGMCNNISVTIEV